MTLNVSMLLSIVPLLAGLGLGLVLRRKGEVDLSRPTMVVIIILIFSLGFSIGSNDTLLESLPRVGAGSIVLMLLAVGFSVLLVASVDRKMHLR